MSSTPTSTPTKTKVAARVYVYTTPSGQTIVERREAPGAPRRAPCKCKRSLAAVVDSGPESERDSSSSKRRKTSNKWKQRFQSEIRKHGRVLKKQITQKDVDTMPAEVMYDYLIGKKAKEDKGVRFVPANSSLGGTVGEDDEDRVEDTENDEQVTSEWFETRFGGCGCDRDGEDEDEYFEDDEDDENSVLVLGNCSFCALSAPAISEYEYTRNK